VKSLLVLCLLCAPALADPKPEKAVTDKGVTEKSRLEVQPAQKAFKKLTIDNPLGGVRVEGYDGTAIMIETHKHAPDDDTLERMRVKLVPNGDNGVRIVTYAASGREAKQVARSQVGIDLVIRAPHDARIDATVTSGKLEVVNMDAGAELDSASGAISTDNVAGELLTHTVSGQTSIVKAFGSVDAATISSDVDLDSITGEKLVASATKGHIAGRRVRSRYVDLTTTDGRIILEGEAALHGHLVVSSLHGDVDVRLHHHGGLVVRARGTKVDLGADQQAIEHRNGWSQMAIGRSTDDTAAQIDLTSRYGVVRFAVIE
jgi:hypothetical protein